MTDIQTTRFVRKPLFVDAVQVTAENLEKLAELCGGTIGRKGHRQFIRLYLQYVRTPRQTVAFPGDWITKVGDTFKVWTNKSFRETFDPALSGLKSLSNTLDTSPEQKYHNFTESEAKIFGNGPIPNTP